MVPREPGNAIFSSRQTTAGWPVRLKPVLNDGKIGKIEPGYQEFSAL
jgi:hypothetical protein